MWPFTDWMEQLYRTLKPTDPYYAHWKHFRNGLIYRYLGGAAVVLFPAFGLGYLIASNVFQSNYAIYAGMAAGWLAMMLSYLYFPLMCPRCKSSFYGKIWDRDSPSYERCLHCGLQLYAPHGDF